MYMDLCSHLLKKERNFYHLQTLLSYRSGERKQFFFLNPEDASKGVGNRPSPMSFSRAGIQNSRCRGNPISPW